MDFEPQLDIPMSQNPDDAVAGELKRPLDWEEVKMELVSSAPAPVDHDRHQVEVAESWLSMQKLASYVRPILCNGIVQCSPFLLPTLFGAIRDFFYFHYLARIR